MQGLLPHLRGDSDMPPSTAAAVTNTTGQLLSISGAKLNSYVSRSRLTSDLGEVDL